MLVSVYTLPSISGLSTVKPQPGSWPERESATARVSKCAPRTGPDRGLRAAGLAFTLQPRCAPPCALTTLQSLAVCTFLHGILFLESGKRPFWSLQVSDILYLGYKMLKAEGTRKAVLRPSWLVDEEVGVLQGRASSY